MKTNKHVLRYSLAASLTLMTAASQAQEAKGWDRTVRTADYLEPAIPHPTQQQAALEKLRQFEARTGRKAKHSDHTRGRHGLWRSRCIWGRSDAWRAQRRISTASPPAD